MKIVQFSKSNLEICGIRLVRREASEREVNLKEESSDGNEVLVVLKAKGFNRDDNLDTTLDDAIDVELGSSSSLGCGNWILKRV